MRLFTLYTKRKLERLLNKYCAFGLFACSLFGFLYISLTSADSLRLNNDVESFNRHVAVDQSEKLKEYKEAQKQPSQLFFKRTFIKSDFLPDIYDGTGHANDIRESDERNEMSDNNIYAHDPAEYVNLKINQSAKHPKELYFYNNIIVHFDLKGAPPKLTYFLQLLDLVAKSGATGVLIEWEDMFPWEGVLEKLRNTDAYSKKDVETILKRAKMLGLEVIPLVQTFGHLEWILKYEEFRKFRENDNYPQVICIGDHEAVELVKEVVEQVVRVHKPFGLKHFHIGADEAFEYGTCEASAKLVRKLGSLGRLAVEHLVYIANYTKRISSGATILAWHDLLQKFPTSDMVEAGLNKLIQPVIWDYSENLQVVQTSLVETLIENFGQVWASSAFKGADSPNTKYSRYKHYEANNLRWVIFQQELRKESPTYKIQGIIITGWSRYDHMACLCEIWPVAEPTMILSVQIALLGAHRAYKNLRPKDISRKARQRTLQILDCETKFGWVVRKCKFPGAAFYKLFQEDYRDVSDSAEHDLKINYQIKGWLTEYNIQHGISQNWYLNQISLMLKSHRDQLRTAAKLVRRNMLELFHDSTVDEFFFEHVEPLIRKIDHYLSSIAKLRKIYVQEKRQFKIHSYYNSFWN